MRRVVVAAPGSPRVHGAAAGDGLGALSPGRPPASGAAATGAAATGRRCGRVPATGSTRCRRSRPRGAPAALRRGAAYPHFLTRVAEDVAERALDAQIAHVVVGRRAAVDDRQRGARAARHIRQARHRVHLERRARRRSSGRTMPASRNASSITASGSISPNSTTPGFSGAPQSQRGTPSASPVHPPLRLGDRQPRAARRGSRRGRASRAPRARRSRPRGAGRRRSA